VADTLQVVNYFKLTAQGLLTVGKQGETADDVDTPYSLTITGPFHHLTAQLGTASIMTLWNGAVNSPASFKYLFLWADRDVYLQLVTASKNVVIKVAAKLPFVLPGDVILPTTNTTSITGGAEPAPETITLATLGNYSGQTADVVFAVIN